MNHGAKRNSGSAWAAVHAGEHWPMIWKIAPSTRVSGAYTILTTKANDDSGQVADWGLSSWHGHGAVRNSGSSRVATHSGDYWLMDWNIEESTRTPGTYTIKTTHHEGGAQPAGWGLAAWMKHGGKRNDQSSWTYTHAGDHWLMDWKMEKTTC